MSDIFDLTWAESLRTTTTATFSMDNQSATLVGYIDPAALSPMDAGKEILGGCVVDEGGGLDRTLPLAHPQFNWLFASEFSIRGVSFGSKEEVDNAYLEAPPIKNYAYYSTYEYQIKFTPRPYVVAENSSISSRIIAWYDDAGTPQSTIAAEEYYRFTDYEEQPAAEYLSAQQGQFKFVRTDEDEPHGKTVPGQLRLLQKTSIIKFRWYQVPYSYVESENSFINAAHGKINQLDWYGWKAGTLLFMNYSYKRYTPPNPGTFTWSNEVISNDKLIDIEFVFKRFDPGELAVGARPPLFVNNNFIDAGHNLLPWLAGVNNGYYYAQGGDNVNNSPLYASYPFQLMFADPDADV